METHRIEHEGCWAEIRPSNLITEDQYDRYKLRCYPLQPLLAEEYGAAEDLVDLRLTQFSRLSSRIAKSGGLDFELISPNDFASVIKRKFEGYIMALDTEKQFTFVSKCLDYFYGLDAPADPDIAPGVTHEDNPKGEPPESGSEETSSNTSSTQNAPNGEMMTQSQS